MAGDIVWCNFPHFPTVTPGPKPRPALVIEARELASGKHRVLVAYGTSKKLTQMKVGEFKIEKRDDAAFVLAGLQTSTKFSLQESVEFDYNDEWFKPPPNTPFGECPKLGILHASLMRRAAAAWNALNL